MAAPLQGSGAMVQGVEFGFVPSQVIRDLRDIGNWKVMPCMHPAVLMVPHIALRRCSCWQLGDMSVQLPRLFSLWHGKRMPSYFELLCKSIVS